MTERSQPRLFELLRARSEIDLNQSAVDRLMIECAHFAEQSLAYIKSDPNIKTKLEKLQRELEQNPETLGSPPSLVTVHRIYLYNNFIEPVKSRAQQAQLSGDANSLSLFAGRLDFWSGGMIILGALRDALREETEKERDTRVDKMSSKAGGVFGALSPEEIEDLRATVTNSSLGGKELMKLDPTGFRLLNEVFMQLKAAGSDVFTFHNKPLVLQGAEFGRDAYKTVYLLGTDG